MVLEERQMSARAMEIEANLVKHSFHMGWVASILDRVIIDIDGNVGWNSDCVGSG